MFAPRSSRPLTVASYPQNNRLRRKKKGENAAPAIELERILGLTASKPTAMATAPSKDLVAYAAGSVVVLYNHKKNKQIGFLHASSMASPSSPSNQANSASWSNRHTIAGDIANPLGSLGLLEHSASNANGSSNSSKKTPVSNKAKPISCVAFSPDGNYLAVGETGHQPRILIWEVDSKTLINELKGHKFGVLALIFSPNMKYVISLGFQHDGYLNVWNWKTGAKLACNKITTKVHTLAFSSNGSFFVTAGLRHVKFWYFDQNGNLPKKTTGQTMQKSLVQVLDGRSGILGDLKENNFVGAACCQKSDHTYFVTSNGLLCMFTEARLMDKWVNLQVKGALSIDVSEQYIVCACTNGIVRLFEPITLKYVGTLPKPHQLGVDLTLQTGTTYNGSGSPNDIYPDTVSVKLDAETGKLSCIYSDRSFFIWDVKDIKKIGKYRSFLYHCDTIWGVEMIPIRDSTDTSNSLPENTFVTYSADSTIRFWNLDNISAGGNENGATNIKRNIYSKECMKIVYVDPDGTYKSGAVVAATKTGDDESSESNVGNSVAPTEAGIRTLRISPDGKLMASGDRGGNLRVHNLDTFEEITYQEAHDAEILTIEFTDGNAPGSPYLIATASRDRILHVFDINNNFQLIQTLDDHSSSITAIKFTNDGGRLISCGADKSIIFRGRQNNADFPYYVTYHNISGRATVFDMDIDISNRYIATVSGERRLNVYHIDTGKNVRSYKSDTPDEVNVQDQGSLLKISLDPGGVHAVTGGSDKSIRLFDFSNGNILGKVLGHSELITGVKFTPDCERIISTSADGCIFVWKVSDELVAKMRQKWLDRSGVLGQSAERNSPYLSPTSTPILTPASTSPPTIHPRTTMPAQRPQSLIMDLQASDDANGQDLEFTVRKRPVKAKKSLGSLTPAALQAEESSRKLKRPASFANDNIEHSKSTQVTPPPRPVSEFSPTSSNSSEFSNSRLPQPTVFIADGINTPPNTPSSPNFAKRESWKIGLPNWAKKAFKEKEEEKEKPKKSSNMSVSIASEPINMDKKLPAIPGKSISKVKSRSKLRQDSTQSMLGVDPDDTNDNSLSDNASFDESLTLSPSFSSNQPPPMIEDDSGGVDADDDDDDNIYSPEENAGSDNEDTETIYIEPQVEECDETVDDNDNRKRRKGSFVGSIKVVELDDRSKSPSGSDKDIEVDINCEEEEREEEDDVESGEDNAKKLEMYLQTPVQSCFGENIHNGQNSEEKTDKDTVSKKRLSFTTKFYSEGHREGSSLNNEKNSLVEALAKIMGNPEENEEDSKDTNRDDRVEKALEVLEGRTDEMVSKEANIEDEQQQLPLSSNTTTIKNSDKEASPSLTTLNKVKVKQDENETTIKKTDEKGDGLGIIVHDKTIDDASDTDEPITRHSTCNTMLSDEEDCIMKDVIALTDLLEKTLMAYKKASSNSKNESIANLIAESLKGMMEDIQKSIGTHEDKQQWKQQQSKVKSPNFNNDDDVESNISYTTALTANSNVVNGLQNSPPFDNNNSSKNSSKALSPLLETPPPSTHPSKSGNQQDRLSEDHTQNLLEKYSELLVKMVEEKMSKINTPSPSNSQFTLVTSPIISNGNNNSNHVFTSTSTSNSRPTKSKSIPVGIGRPKTIKSPRN